MKWMNLGMGLVMLAGCVPSSGNPGPVTQAGTHYQDWVGKWNGPEGTYLILDLNTEMNGFNVTIANLDGPRTFLGDATNKGIAFERDGVREIIVRGNGEQTGMKWLTDKEECLVIKAGEGYCRY